jgi:hypothetical protein
MEGRGVNPICRTTPSIQNPNARKKTHRVNPPRRARSGTPSGLAACRWIWELLDPAFQEALLEGRLIPEELHDLAGWLDEHAETEP